MKLWRSWQHYARQLKSEVYALYLAGRDSRVPWPAKLFVAGVVAYAFSPIDLIPDFIPVLGYLDDIVLLPAGLWLAIRLIPPEVLADCRVRAQAELRQKPRNWAIAVLIVALWLLLAAAGILLIARVLGLR